MKKNAIWKYKTLILLIGLALSLPVVFSPSLRAAPYTPKAGSQERKAILDALRKPVEKRAQQKVVFHDVKIRAENGWAYVDCLAMDRSGKTYAIAEVLIGALLRKQGVQWRLLYWDMANDPSVAMEALKKYPKAPRAIFNLTPDILPGYGSIRRTNTSVHKTKDVPRKVPAQLPGKQAIQQKLDMLLRARSFSAKHPLTQTELFEVVAYAGNWQLLPKHIVHGEGVSTGPQADDYITRPEAQKLIRWLTGANLTYWNVSGYRGAESGVLGWNYNSGNTMHEPRRSKVRTVKRIAPSTLSVKFDIFYSPENLTTHSRLRNIGSGTAQLQWNGRDWIIAALALPKQRAI